jgi:hypothetical protein
MPLSFESMRVGQKYVLVNHREVSEFTVEEILPGNNYLLKDLHTLEKYTIKDLIRFGKFDDFDLNELE